MCIALWSEATGTDLSHQPRCSTTVWFCIKNGSLTYLSPTIEIIMKPIALPWFGSQGSHEGIWYPWGFLLQILTTFVSSATIVSVLLHYCEHHFTAWYIVFSLKNRVHRAIYIQYLALTHCSNVWSCIPSLTGLIVLDAFPSFDSLFRILLEWLFHYIPAVVL